MLVARSKRVLASLFASALLATGIMAPVASAQDQDGLVNVNVENVLNNNDINVVVSVNAAAAIAANVCGVVVDANVLAAVDEGDDEVRTTCNSASRAFNTGTLEITNN
jgi:hypothetical protein